VNLMAIGKAISNVFDGVKVFSGGGVQLKGIDQTCEIGFLTLLEVLRLAKVGVG